MTLKGELKDEQMHNFINSMIYKEGELFDKDKLNRDKHKDKY